eukprot:4598979-Prymnesium_polylepis.1
MRGGFGRMKGGLGGARADGFSDALAERSRCLGLRVGVLLLGTLRLGGESAPNRKNRRAWGRVFRVNPGRRGGDFLTRPAGAAAGCSCTQTLCSSLVRRRYR